MHDSFLNNWSSIKNVVFFTDRTILWIYDSCTDAGFSILWYNALETGIYTHKHFVKAWCLHLQSSKWRVTWTAMKMEQQANPKCSYISIDTVSCLRQLKSSGQHLVPLTRCLLSWKRTCQCLTWADDSSHVGIPFFTTWKRR